MYVILNKDIKGLGKKFQVVDVAEGYAKNYLIPKKLATVANNKTISEANSKKSAASFKSQTKKEEAEKIKEKIEKNILTFNLKMGKNSKLFGSITSKEICEEINNSFEYNIDKKKIEIDNQIKLPGTYTVKIKLYEGITAIQKIEVIGE